MKDFGHEVALAPDDARAKVERLYRECGCHLPDVADKLGVALKTLYTYLGPDRLNMHDRLREIRKEATKGGWLKVPTGRISGRSPDKRPRKRRVLTEEHKARISRSLRRTA